MNLYPSGEERDEPLGEVHMECVVINHVIIDVTTMVIA